MVSSISDMPSYREACRRAATDDQAFATFRQDSSYRQILEHVDPADATEMAQMIVANSPHFLASLDELRRNDEIGGADIYDFGAIGRLSPSTVRYIKVASDLERIFGSLDGLSVVEIGGGYGGQARVLEALWKLTSYTIFDLPEAGALAKRYLGHFGLDVAINPPPSSLPAPGLVVSNYAFSELSRGVQNEYLPMITASQRGYMLYNEVFMRGASAGLFPENQSISDEGMVQLIPTAQVGRQAFLSPMDFSCHVSLLVWGAAHPDRVV